MTRAAKNSLIVIASVVALAILAYALFVAYPTMRVSKIVWDAKTTVPGTGITFSYPKEGFDGQGVRLVNNQWPSDLFSFAEIESLYLISLPEKMGSQSTYVRIFDVGDVTNLEQVIQKLGNEGGTTPQGRYQEINGTRYFLQPSVLSTEFKIYAYAAYAIANKQLVVVNFQGGFDGSNDTATPNLVTQFLSRLDFSCTSDCSSNSVPVTNAFREGL